MVKIVLKSIKGLLNTWCYGEWTYIGGVTVKNWYFLMLFQSLTALLYPPEWAIKEVQCWIVSPVHLHRYFFLLLRIFLDNFLWNWKNNQIKCTVVINGYEEWDLKCNILNIFVLHWKCLGSTIRRTEFSPWKTLLLSSIQRCEGDSILSLTKGLEVLARKLNQFWKDLFYISFRIQINGYRYPWGKKRCIREFSVVLKIIWQIYKLLKKIAMSFIHCHYVQLKIKTRKRFSIFTTAHNFVLQFILI